MAKSTPTPSQLLTRAFRNHTVELAEQTKAVLLEQATTVLAEISATAGFPLNPELQAKADGVVVLDRARRPVVPGDVLLDERGNVWVTGNSEGTLRQSRLLRGLELTTSWQGRNPLILNVGDHYKLADIADVSRVMALSKAGRVREYERLGEETGTTARYRQEFKARQSYANAALENAGRRAERTW